MICLIFEEQDWISIHIRLWENLLVSKSMIFKSVKFKELLEILEEKNPFEIWSFCSLEFSYHLPCTFAAKSSVAKYLFKHASVGGWVTTVQCLWFVFSHTRNRTSNGRISAFVVVPSDGRISADVVVLSDGHSRALWCGSVCVQWQGRSLALRRRDDPHTKESKRKRRVAWDWYGSGSVHAWGWCSGQQPDQFSEQHWPVRAARQTTHSLPAWKTSKAAHTLRRQIPSNFPRARAHFHFTKTADRREIE